MRTSSQTPFITKRKLCYLFDLRSHQVRVFCERVGGGFGAKQEMITEDSAALATLGTGRPGQLGIHARRGIHGVTTRHPMKSHQARRAAPTAH